MEPATHGIGQLLGISKRIVRGLFTTLENRLELLLVEVQEERERLIHAFLLALALTAFGLLAGITLTAGIAVLLWPYSPVAALFSLAGVYSAAAMFLYRRLTGMLRDWEHLSDTLDQLKKDRACLENHLT